MECINTGLRSIALVVDADNRMLGTLTDGDIRRSILAEMSLDTRAKELLFAKNGFTPVTAPVGTEPDHLLSLMHEHSVRQVPLLDGDSRVVDLVTQEDLLPEQPLLLQAMIMAGGLGARLRPLTEDLPKAMLPVGGRPLMELIVKGLRQAGIRRVNVSTNYKSEKIVEHFGDGGNFGVEFKYTSEDRPLGTAGALGLMEAPQETLLVINGDILTDVDFRAMLAYHREHQAVLTVAVRKYGVSVPYGVLKADGPFVQSLVEKPDLNFFINAGIYLLEPEARNYIPNSERFDMTDLIQRLLESGRLVASFPIHEYWLDIGQPTDYLQAQDDVEKRRARA